MHVMYMHKAVYIDIRTLSNHQNLILLQLVQQHKSLILLNSPSNKLILCVLSIMKLYGYIIICGSENTMHKVHGLPGMEGTLDFVLHKSPKGL